MSLLTFWVEDSLSFSSLDCSRSFFFMSPSWPSSSCSLFLRCSLSLEEGGVPGGGGSEEWRLMRFHYLNVKTNNLDNFAKVSPQAKPKKNSAFILSLVGIFLCRLKCQNQFFFLFLQWIHWCLQTLNIFLQDKFSRRLNFVHHFLINIKAISQNIKIIKNML